MHGTLLYCCIQAPTVQMQYPYGIQPSTLMGTHKVPSRCSAYTPLVNTPGYEILT